MRIRLLAKMGFCVCVSCVFPFVWPGLVPTFSLLASNRISMFRTAEGAQGAELSQCHIFKDSDDVVFIQWIHRPTKRLAMEHNMYYA